MIYILIFVSALFFYIGRDVIINWITRWIFTTPQFRQSYLEMGEEKSGYMASKMSIIAMSVENRLSGKKKTSIEEKNIAYKEAIYDFVNNVINDESGDDPRSKNAPQGYHPEFWIKLATLDGGLEPWIHSDWSDEDLEKYIASDYKTAKNVVNKTGFHGKNAEFFSLAARRITEVFRKEIKRIQQENSSIQRKYKNT